MEYKKAVKLIIIQTVTDLMNRLSVGNTSQGSFCQSNTKEAAEERNVPGYKEPLYS